MVSRFGHLNLNTVGFKIVEKLFVGGIVYSIFTGSTKVISIGLGLHLHYFLASNYYFNTQQSL